MLVYTQRKLNISQTVDMLQTRQLSHSSIVRFVQEQIQAGRLVAAPGDKRSEKVLEPSPALESAIEHYLSAISTWQKLYERSDGIELDG